MEGYILAEKDDINAKITEDSSPDDAEKKENTQNFFKNVLKTSGDIAKEKQIYNSGNYIGNNQAKNLMIIENAVINGGMSLNDYNIKDVTTNVRNVDKVYDLSIAEEFAEFGEKVKGGEHFAVAVILCVFEYVELDDLQDLKLKLLNEFPKTNDEEGNEIAIRQNPFISIDSLLKTINGKMFVLDNGTNCIGLGKNRPQALKNLWQQFPSLRSSIARWMINVSDTFQYRTNFKTAQITNAFVNVLKMDFNAGVNHFFQRFVSDSEKYILLGLIAIELYNDINYRQKILPFIKQWADSSSSWKWKSALYVYSNIKYEERDAEFGKPPATVWENVKIMRANPDKVKVLTAGDTLTADIVDSFVASILYRWSNELEDRIIPAVEAKLRLFKHLEDDDDLDKKRWKAIKAVRIELGKDKEGKKSICTRLKDALEARDYDTASALQLEMTRKIEALEDAYREYKNNILDD